MRRLTTARRKDVLQRGERDAGVFHDSAVRQAAVASGGCGSIAHLHASIRELAAIGNVGADPISTKLVSLGQFAG